MPALPPGRDGRALLELVREFADLGDHRTGTGTDDETRAWFAALAARDLDVELDRYTFDRFDADTALTADGATVEHLRSMDIVRDVTSVMRVEGGPE